MWRWLLRLALVACSGPTSEAKDNVPNFPAGAKRGFAGGGNADPASYGSGAKWTQTQLQAALTDGAPKIWMNYTIRSGGTAPPSGRFVPQFWDLAGVEYVGADPFNNTTIGVAVTEAGAGGWISLLNEPYNGTPGVTAGAVTPTDAAAAWDTLRRDSRVIANNIKLLSPATTNTAGAQAWMSEFLARINTAPPDAMAIHQYANGTTGPIIAGIVDAKQRYPGVPIWLTEFSWENVAAVDSDIINFQNALIPLLEAEPLLQYFCWFFMGPKTTTGLTGFDISLYDDSGVVRAIGTNYNGFG